MKWPWRRRARELTLPLLVPENMAIGLSIEDVPMWAAHDPTPIPRFTDPMDKNAPRMLAYTEIAGGTGYTVNFLDTTTAHPTDPDRVIRARLRIRPL